VEVGFKEGKFEALSRTRNVLLNLFSRLKGHFNSFTEEQQQTIIQWNEEVSRPSRRERRLAARFGSDLLLEERLGKKRKT